MNGLFLTFLNLMCISAALIPFFIIHSFLFYYKSGIVKVIFALISAFIILPAVFFICYKKIFITGNNQLFSGDYILYVFAYSGIIALNYLIFIILKYKRAEAVEKTTFLKIRYFLSLLLLIFIIYLSIPTFLIIVYLKNPNTYTARLAENLSVFEQQKKILKSYTENVYEIYIYPENQ